MKTTKKRRPLKSTEEQWKDIFAEWATSGLNDAEFCKRENYSIDAFRSWRTRLDEPELSNPSISLKRTKFQVRSDAGKQRWIRDEKKEAFWRRHIQAWKASGLSKHAYCKSKQLTESSFNAWCREIELRNREKVTSSNAAELLDETVGQTENPFVPLHLVPNEPTRVQFDNLPIADEPRHSISIHVPGGAVIKVEDCSVEFFSKFYSSLKCEVQPC